ncbi:hypothetical protein MVES1_000691 [Malassezia vespertilionis]|uniref:uncharacterized protein n=1 Tax=Malassezia vespertilionis TaxID=2020962 RepID=UPI0024B0F4C3|nr:uncharacterized protein MVES1_000691 [Malassezia vespertilionis]WFD05361.1 hypothetical protein MVES1_000691 [Malassezia vespertilionis]
MTADAKRRPKRKRVRKSRTAVVSSSDSSSSDESAAPTLAKSSAPARGGDDSDASVGFDEESNEHDVQVLDDAVLEEGLEPPTLHLSFDEGPETSRRNTTKRLADDQMAMLTTESISEQLQQKQRNTFRTLWMQAVTEEFGDELDAMRQDDPRLSTETTTTSSATSRLPLLIDALSFGSEVFPGAQDTAGPGSQAVDEVALALPA